MFLYETHRSLLCDANSMRKSCMWLQHVAVHVWCPRRGKSARAIQHHNHFECSPMGDMDLNKGRIERPLPHSASAGPNDRAAPCMLTTMGHPIPKKKSMSLKASRKHCIATLQTSPRVLQMDQAAQQSSHLGRKSSIRALILEIRPNNRCNDPFLCDPA